MIVYMFANGKDQSSTCEEKKALEYMQCLYTYMSINKIIDKYHKQRKKN